MRNWLLHHRQHLGVAAVGVAIVVIVPAVALSSYRLGPPIPSATPTSAVVPQAAASAPEPTLSAVAATALATQTSGLGTAGQATQSQTTAGQATQGQAETQAPNPAPTPDASSPFAGIAEPPAQPPPRATPIHHTVADGEVLWQIAEQYNLRPETILWANDIQDADLLLVGQDLLIPPTDGVEYTVRPGDRLVDVADRYGVDLQSLVSANQLDDADQIQAGIDIFLPGGRPIAATATATTGDTTTAVDDQTAAANGEAVVLPDDIDAMLASGWLGARQLTTLYKSAGSSSAGLHQLPRGARLERLSGVTAGRIQVRDPGDGRTRQAMTGWVDAVDLDVARAPATRELPLAYPADTAMDIFHVFAPYRSQLDGSPYAEANCGPTALGMALDALGVSVGAPQLRSETLSAQHMFGNSVGTLITALAQVAEEHGLSANDLRTADGALKRWTLDDLRAHIQQGQPVVVQVRYRSLPGRGGAYYFGDHYILVTGVVGDGFLYNDPIDIDGLGWDRVISGTTLRVAMNASASQYAYSAVAIGR